MVENVSEKAFIMRPRLFHDPQHALVSTTAIERGIVHVMPSDALLNLKSKSAPLSASERARCERVAARLHSDLGSLIAALPEHARGGSGMSRYLDIVRNTCQRVSLAVSDHEANIETLCKLPGTKGLESLLDAMRKRGIDQGLIEIGASAVAQFDTLIRDYGGSHTKLIARIEAGDGTESPLELASLKARQSLYQAGVGITGRAAETTISLYAFREAPNDPDTLQRAVATGMIQTTVIPGGMPVVISNGSTVRWDDEGDQTMKNLNDSDAVRSGLGSTADALLKEYCSQPLPMVSSRGDTEGFLRVIDPMSLEHAQTFDVVSAARSNGPMMDANGDPVFDEIWSLSNCPSKKLIFDVYLHADMEKRYRPSIDAQMWNPNLSAPGGDKWVLRYPQVPTLELLGQGIGNSACDGYSRHADLTATFFDRIGWNPGEFFGFRCEIEFPIWRGGYCMKFAPIKG